MSRSTTDTKVIKFDKLLPNPWQNICFGREEYDQSLLDKLVRSIQENTFWLGIRVRPHATRRGFYELVFGHHRVRAAAKCGLTQAEFIVVELTDEQMLIELMHENAKDASADYANRRHVVEVGGVMILALYYLLVAEQGGDPELGNVTQLELGVTNQQLNQTIARTKLGGVGENIVTFYLKKHHNPIPNVALKLALQTIKADVDLGQRIVRAAESRFDAWLAEREAKAQADAETAREREREAREGAANDAVEAERLEKEHEEAERQREEEQHSRDEAVAKAKRELDALVEKAKKDSTIDHRAVNLFKKANHAEAFLNAVKQFDPELGQQAVLRAQQMDCAKWIIETQRNEAGNLTPNLVKSAVREYAHRDMALQEQVRREHEARVLNIQRLLNAVKKNLDKTRGNLAELLTVVATLNEATPEARKQTRAEIDRERTQVLEKARSVLSMIDKLFPGGARRKRKSQEAPVALAQLPAPARPATVRTVH